jgi:hypothetical protein
MGEYAAYVSDKYPTEDHVAAVVAKHEPLISKYYPEGLGIEQKVNTAKLIQQQSPQAWEKWIKRQINNANGTALAAAAKANPRDLEAVGRYIAWKMTPSITSADVANFARDQLVAMATFTDPKDVTKERKRKEGEKAFVEQAIGQQGMFAEGSGPRVFTETDFKDMGLDLKGLLGNEVIIVKKGAELAPTGMSPATMDGKGVNCFLVPPAGISVIKPRGHLTAWFAAHSGDYLVRPVEGGIEGGQVGVSAMTGQNLQYGDDTQQTIGVEITAFKGLYLDEEQYEVIDPGFTILKHFASRGEGIVSSVALGVLKAPSEIAEKWRQAQEVKENIETIVDKGQELIEKLRKIGKMAESEKESPAAPIRVKFTQTAGEKSLDCLGALFDVGGVKACGVRIGDIAEQVLGWASA